MLTYYNIPFNFNHDNLDDYKIMRFVDHMQMFCNSQWIYNAFKDSYTPSIYLDTTRKNPKRKKSWNLEWVIIF